MTADERRAKISEQVDYLSGGGLGEVAGFTDLAFNSDVPTVKMDTAMAAALIRLAGDGIKAGLERVGARLFSASLNGDEAIAAEWAKIGEEAALSTREKALHLETNQHLYDANMTLRERVKTLEKERDTWIEHTRTAVWSDSAELRAAEVERDRAVESLQAIAETIELMEATGTWDANTLKRVGEFVGMAIRDLADPPICNAHDPNIATPLQHPDKEAR